MPHWLWFSLSGLMLVAVAVFAGMIGWIIAEPWLIARRIPPREIEALADALMREHPNAPEAQALLEEHAAWHRSRAHDRVLWSLVRREIRRRQTDAGRRPHPS